MKKMSSIRELKLEKQRLHMRQQELEKAIRYDWRDVKESLRLNNIVKQALNPVTGEGDKVPELVTEIATRFTKKLVEKVPGNLSAWIRKKASGSKG